MASITKEVITAYALDNAKKHEGSASPKAVLASLFAEGLKKEEIGLYMPSINEVVARVNSLSLQEQQNELEQINYKTSKRVIRVGLPELPQAISGQVVMRFAPYPSGPLHIGNARGLILNDEYVKKYGGRLVLVMDDTIGSIDKPIQPDAYSLIEKGVRWTGATIDKKIIYKSDRIEKYYEYALELLEKGYLYVCDCENEKRRELKRKGIECSCRHLGPEKQLMRWEHMKTAEEGSVCVRLKTSMQDPDPAFRDRVMFRISDRPHARTRTKYRVYPLLDFSWAIDDHFLGITHILRGMELAIETRTEQFIWDIFGWKHPTVLHHGHFGLSDIKLSKSKGAQEVLSGTYSGWDDPRTWSLQSLKNRGILPQSLREFVLQAGIRKTNVTVPIEVLYAINKKNCGAALHFSFIKNPLPITIAGCPELEAHVPLHPSENQGYKKYLTSQEFIIAKQDSELMENKTYRLAHLLNFTTDTLASPKPRTYSFHSTTPDKKLNAHSIQWLVKEAPNISATIRMPDGSTVRGLVEPEASRLKEGDIVHFERVGYARLTKKRVNEYEFWFAHI